MTGVDGRDARVLDVGVPDGLVLDAGAPDGLVSDAGVPEGLVSDARVLDARVLVVMGVSGSGKSTVAATVAERLGWDFAEGDAMHPRSNVDKMQAGTPLSDEDRWPWLDVVAGWIHDHLDAGTPGVVTCSALKRSYRDVLRAPGVVFVHVAGDGALIAERMAARSGHFMPTSLLASQLATLELPGPDEVHVTVAADRTPDEEADEVVERLGLAVR